MGKTILIFGSLAAAILILFELNKLSFWGFEANSEVLIVLSGTLFIFIGILIHRFLLGKQTHQGSRILKKSNLTKQEHKVLRLMDEGLSNHDIAEQLYISESTVKTHVSNVLTKLHAKRRTEAIKIGRDLNII